MDKCRPCSLQADICSYKKSVFVVLEICARNVRTGKYLRCRLLETGNQEYACPLFINFSRYPILTIIGERGSGLDSV